MSGIAGISYLDGRQVDRQDVERMVRILAHRGPDKSGIWNEGTVGLGHCMLWTTPESLREQLPLVHSTGSFALTSDARIDNRDDLIPVLRLIDRPSGEISDSELILAAYAKWGDSCPERLIGDFAFAIWDNRERKMFCARDGMGLKPLYYYASDRTFVFASELKALLCLPEVPHCLNEERVADHITLTDDDRESTFYKSIFQLPAGHALVVGAGRLEKHRYWFLDPERELVLPSDDAYVEALRDVFTEAVKCRLRSAFPVGSMLSGGLDSSSIVCVARQLLMKQGAKCLHTFSVIFPSLAEAYPKIDERPWIEAVLELGQLNPHYIRADEMDPLSAITFFPDEPIAVPNMYLYWFAFNMANKDGIRVMFSGYDGDTVLAYGVGYFAELARAFKWKTLISEARILAKRMNWPLRATLWNFGLRMLVPAPARHVWRTVRRQTPPSTTYDLPVNPAFAERLDLAKRVKALQGDLALPRTAREIHLRYLSQGLLLSGPELFDKASAVCSLEVRLPFFDRRVIEFCLALPTRLKLHQGWNRYIMRRAMEGILPPKVQWRISKGDLSRNIRHGLIKNNREILEEVILHNSNLIARYMDEQGVRAAYHRFASSPLETSERDLFTILVAFTLGNWLRFSGVVSQA